jgi:hypothetical protein
MRRHARRQIRNALLGAIGQRQRAAQGNDRAGETSLSYAIQMLRLSGRITWFVA